MPASSRIRSDRVDAGEVEKFGELARSWWDPGGPMRPLHLLNPCRVGWVRDRLCDHYRRDKASLAPLDGLEVLDVGSGGGLLAEPMARLGARVTGLDPTAELVEVARWHAAQTGVNVDYQLGETGSLVGAGCKFDAVLALEVIEHVPDPAAFLGDVAALTRPGGIALLATVSRTWRSWAFAILGAEYALRWLPPGTHDWQRFLRPSEIGQLLRRVGLRPVALTGVGYDAARIEFRTVRDTSVNYMLAAARD
ncbi:MAG: bifunctional 2-polyprenyl-6-hydroxyphenol methylase/3-demethylubiquinol 3-O-methyltransferase UbiG [Geminicoccaceae bacterium]